MTDSGPFEYLTRVLASWLRTGQNLLKSKGLYLDWDVCDAVGVVDFQIHFKGRYKMSLILNNSNLMTLVEANKRKGYLNEGYESFVLEVARTHGILDVMPFYPASNGQFHKYTQAVKTGSGKWRGLNEGRAATKGAVESKTVPVQLFSSESNISEDVLAVAESPMETRSSEDLLVLTGVVEDWINTLINGDGSKENEMYGFEYYRNKLGEYCLDGKGTNGGHLTSIYLVELGKNSVNIRYNPQLTGDKMGIGLKMEDRGRIRAYDKDNNGYYAFNTTFDLTSGLEVRRDSSLIRIANIDPTKTFDDNLFIDAMSLLPESGRDAVAIVPRPIYTQVLKYAKDKSNVNMSIEEIKNFGRIPMIFGIPLIREDAISLTQKKYSA